MQNFPTTTQVFGRGEAASIIRTRANPKRITALEPVGEDEDGEDMAFVLCYFLKMRLKLNYTTLVFTHRDLSIFSASV